MQTFIQNSLSAGFLLTKQSQDKANAIVITLWLVSKQGPVKLEIYDELALFFVETSQSTLAINILTEQHLAYEKVTDLPLKTFNQQSASCLYFKTLRDFYAARDALKQMNIKCYEDDFRPDDRYLMERFITAGIQFQGHTHQKKGYLQVNGARCKATKIEQRDRGRTAERCSQIAADKM